jgi:hypothetical protein
MVCSSRIASQGISLADSLSDDFYGDAVAESSEVQSSGTDEIRVTQISAFSRFKAKIVGLWSYAVQRWPSVCPLPLILLVIFFCIKNVER